ncbi:homoserine O-acetyltransferase [Candidatus Chlorohelix allophototropha]|uniref:Homoserine O-acetyltransferase n=1 Tax=Candidatus Chlorohelix allophototropha TaxID=3003348 RepID=A0ABY9B7B3_9CHLR|nr:homoserine O-acetyltransferase [Chloroflexota bacterium L227-S17]
MAIVRTSPLGIVSTQFYTFGSPNEGLRLECGQNFGPITVAYQTYGQLNEAHSNAILICHALTGDSHPAGIHAEDGRLGWWEIMVGPGKAFDTDRYYIICSNVLGGCKGTTGPASTNPATGKPYASNFPVITVEDMVRVQKKLVEYLGIDSLLAVVGGSMGGMQALAWCQLYPESVRAALPIATSPSLTAQGIAWNEIGRRAIMADQNWNGGNYYEPGQARPENGLAVARMLGHITYLSEESMEYKFGRQLRQKDDYSFSFNIDFEVESYLQHQGEIFNQRFDANSYLYITRAMDYYDMTRGKSSLTEAFANTNAAYLFISFSSDWLYPPYQSELMSKAAREAGRYVEYVNITAPNGHDSFLLESEHQAPLISEFLEKIFKG